MTAAQFNARYPIGTLVRYFPSPKACGFVPTKTTSEAVPRLDGKAFVSVIGYPSMVPIEQLEVDRD